jgi:DNA-binding NtrC family response regulator
MTDTRAPIHVLFIDDEPLILRSVERTMRASPRFQAHFAASAFDALDVLAKNDIEIVVSDYDMPEVNGIELLHLLRTQRREIVRIMMTGRLAVSEWEGGVDDGAVQRLIQKPWSLETLMRTLDEAADAIHARHSRAHADAKETRNFRRPIALV